MFDIGKGANEITTEDLEAIFGDNSPATPPEEEQQLQAESKSEEKDVTQTKAFANRLRESTEKARAEEREKLAKELGYSSYDDMSKKREQKVLEDKGYDAEQLQPIIDELVKQRIDNDPRMKELEKYREQEIKEFGKRELAEITKLTNGQITTFEQLPKDVLDLWQKKGSLKSAFLELKGEELILNNRREQSKGSTDHLKGLNGSTAQDTGKRSLTSEERQMWKYFNPQMTDEELNKITVDK